MQTAVVYERTAILRCKAHSVRVEIKQRETDPELLTREGEFGDTVNKARHYAEVMNGCPDPFTTWGRIRVVGTRNGD